MTSEDKFLRKNRKKIILISVSFTIAAMIFTVGAALADQRLDLFLQRYEAMGDRDLPLDHPDNPFRPYLAVPFEEGLNVEQRGQMAKALQRFDCVKIQYLVLEGLVQLYPFLAPAFSEEDRRMQSRLEVMLGTEYSDPIMRCINLRELKEFRDLTLFPPIDLADKIGKGREFAFNHPPDPELDALYDINFSLGKAAFCNDYPPAIGDVRAYANRGGGMLLTEEEELYLTERARIHALLSDHDYRHAIVRIAGPKIDENRMRYVIAASRRLSVDKIEDMTGFWPEACRNMAAAKAERLKSRSDQ